MNWASLLIWCLGCAIFVANRTVSEIYDGSRSHWPFVIIDAASFAIGLVSMITFLRSCVHG